MRYDTFRSIFPMFIIVLLMFAGSGLQAVEPQKNTRDVEDISLEELLSVEVTVASKSRETTADAPSSVSVFTQEEIQRMGISYLEELLNFVAGFQVSRDVEQGTAFRISARGRSTALSESILFLVDGQRINDLYTGGISILNRMMAVENIKQVEIIRGPGSALYGSNAFLGVVNIVTLHDSNNILVKAGNLNSKEISVNVSRKLSQDFSMSAFMKVFSDDGYTYEAVTDLSGQSGETRDPAKGVDAYFTLKYKDLILNGRHMERTFRDFLTFGNLADNTNHETSKQTSFSAAYKWKFTETTSLDLAAGYLQDHWRTLSALIPGGTELAPGFVLAETVTGGPDLKSYNANFSLDLGFQLAKNHWIAVGINYMRTGISRVRNLFSHHPITLDYQGKVVSFSGDASFNEETTRDVVGLYLQNKLELGKNLRITGGVRLDKYSDFGSSINPRAAVIYSTGFGARLKFMYGRAFRAPNFLELYDKNNPVDFGNPDLEPEKVDTIEFAFIQNLKKVQATVTYFQNKISNIILLGASVNHPNNPLEAPAFLNAGKATTKGVELELKSTPLKNIVLSGTYTHLFEGDHPFIPTDFASLVLNYRGKKFNLNLNGIFRSEIELLPDQESYFILNAALKVKLNASLSLLCAVKNLFDENYFTVSQTLSGGVPARGLTASLGLSFTAAGI